MPWTDNGVQNERFLVDQSASINWGSSFVRVPFGALRQVGYLSGLTLKVPTTGVTLTEAAAANIVGPQNASQLPVHRGVQSLAVVAQGIASLIQLGKGGVDAFFLEYVKSGVPVWGEESLALVTGNPTSNVGAMGRPTASLNTVVSDATAGATYGAFSQNVRYGLTLDIPLTEYVLFPASVQPGPNGPVPVAAQQAEVGLLAMQNTAQSVQVQAQLNPLYSMTTDSVFLAANAVPSAGQLSVPVSLYSKFYDVPANPQDGPPPYSRMFIVSKTTTDDAVSGGAVTHTFQPAGMLMKAIYLFFDANDNLVDISQEALQTISTGALPAQGTEGTVAFKWGATVQKYSEPFSINLYRAFRRYGEAPPPGCLIHDFFYDHTITNLINTATLTSVQAQFTGLTGVIAGTTNATTITNMHTIEVRLIPVRTGV